MLERGPDDMGPATQRSQARVGSKGSLGAKLKVGMSVTLGGWMKVSGLQHTTSIRRPVCPTLREPKPGRVLKTCRSHAPTCGSER